MSFSRLDLLRTILCMVLIAMALAVAGCSTGVEHSIRPPASRTDSTPAREDGLRIQVKGAKEVAETNRLAHAIATASSATGDVTSAEVLAETDLKKDAAASPPKKDSPVAGRSKGQGAAGPGRKDASADRQHRMAPAAGNTSGPGDSSGIVLNFDDADIYDVIRLMADLLKINCVVDPTVKGKITLHTAGKLSMEELEPVFRKLLEINGLVMVEDGPLYRITPLKGVAGVPITARFKTEDLPRGQQPVVQVIPLKYMAAKDMVKLLTPFLSPDATILAHEGSNVLVVVDTADNIARLVKLAQGFDVDVFKHFHYKFYKLTYVEPSEMARTIEDILSSALHGSGLEFRVLGLDRLSSLVVITSNPATFGRVEELIKKLDVPSEGTEPRIYVYFVRNGKADQLAGLLNEVFGKVQPKSMTKKEKLGSPLASPPAPNPFLKEFKKRKKEQEAAAKKKASAPSPAVQASSAGGRELGIYGTLSGEIHIVPDETRNALIIEALPRDYHLIRSILDQIDILPRQVLIEVTIAEIALDEAMDLGVEWQYIKGPGSPSTSLLSASMGASGLKFVVGDLGRWSATLSALASKNKVDILASPSLLASDNEEAVINISTEIPIASSSIEYVTGNEPVVQTDIQYRNTGLILSVTPHINERGLVTMTIQKEVSNQASNVSVGGKTYPSFFKRSVNTTLTVKHNQTIVIGGLIKQDRSKGNSGMPWLSELPIIGFLFGKQNERFEKSEIIMLITPHVINTLEDIDAVTEEFRSKVSGVEHTIFRRR